MAERAETATDDEGFDALLEKLRGVVEKLENGNLSLEQSLQSFEECVKLSRRGSTILDRAEKRVEILTRGEGGNVKAVPFPAKDGGDD